MTLRLPCAGPYVYSCRWQNWLSCTISYAYLLLTFAVFLRWQYSYLISSWALRPRTHLERLDCRCQQIQTSPATKLSESRRKWHAVHQVFQEIRFNVNYNLHALWHWTTRSVCDSRFLGWLVTLFYEHFLILFQFYRSRNFNHQFSLSSEGIWSIYAF